MRGVNWRLACRVLEALELERTAEGLLDVFLEQIESIVSYDHAVASCKSRAEAGLAGSRGEPPT